MSAIDLSQHRWIPITLLCALAAAGPLAAEDTRWSVAGNLGRAGIDERFGDRISGWRVDGEEPAAGLEVAYAFGPRIGLEAGYHDLGTYTGLPMDCPPSGPCPVPLVPQPPGELTILPTHPREVEFRAVTLAAVPRLPLGERVSLFGKVGVMDWEGRTIDFHGQDVEDPSDTALLAGFGAEYLFPRGLGVRLEARTSELARTLTLGGSWRF